jgi:hypothetical protein
LSYGAALLHLSGHYISYNSKSPITVAVQSKAWTVFVCSNTGVKALVSVCIYSVCR